jgi:hypothetical protein
VANPKYAPAATNKKMTSTERPMMSLEAVREGG